MVYGVWFMVHGILGTASTIYGLLYIAGRVLSTTCFCIQCSLYGVLNPVFVSYILFTRAAHRESHREPCSLLCTVLLQMPSAGVACAIVRAPPLVSPTKLYCMMALYTLNSY